MFSASPKNLAYPTLLGTLGICTAFLNIMASRSTSSFDVRKYLRRNPAAIHVDSSFDSPTCDHCGKNYHSSLRDSILPTSEGVQKISSRNQRRKMRTVSEDDELVQRAANPRTGIISPFVKGDYGDLRSVDYLMVGSEASKPSPLTRIARKAVGSGPKSQKHELPTAQSTNEPSVIDSSVKPAPSLRLIQYLPRIEFLHPSHFANLERSYRRPARLRPRTGLREEKAHQRPRVQRQGGQLDVPQATDKGETHASSRDVREEVRAKARPRMCPCVQCLNKKPSTKERNPEMMQCLNESGAREIQFQEPKAETSSGPARSNSVLQRHGVWKTLYFSDSKTKWIQERLIEMLNHVFTTLHHASPALQILRSPENVRIEEYAKALKSVFLAGLYIIVLLNILALVARAVRFVLRILAIVGWPARMLWLSFRWVLGT